MVLGDKIYGSEPRTAEENKKFIELMSEAKDKLTQATSEISYAGDFYCINQDLIDVLEEITRAVSRIERKVSNGQQIVYKPGKVIGTVFNQFRMEMKDLRNATIPELDATSVTPSVDGGKVILDSDNYWEEGGIRFFRKPLRVDFGYWSFETMDRHSIVVDKGNSGTIYVFANAISEEGDVALLRWYDKEHLRELGYNLLQGASSKCW